MLFLALAALLSPSAHAWSPVIACDNNRMVVDVDGGATDRYQLVIRDRLDTIGYFASKADVHRNVNVKNELIIAMIPGGPTIEGRRSYYVGTLMDGSTNVLISQEGPDAIRVALWYPGYRGYYPQELANWIFRGCSIR